MLGLWVVARFPVFGPQTLRSSIVACLVSIGLLQAVEPAMEWTAAVTSPGAALLLVATPIFGSAFWSGGVLLRALRHDLGPPRPERVQTRRKRR